jgi:MFS family permease
MANTNVSKTSPTPSLGKTAVWLICIMAAIGFAFDIYELLMLPLIIKSAVFSLSEGKFVPGSDEYREWARTLFFVPALVGGVFGLLGGYLTDFFGRRRVLTYSILLYALSAFAAGFTTNLYQLLVCRCFVFIGVCVEFVAAVAWLAELFPDHKQRERVLGFTQAFSSFGGILVAGANYVCAQFANELPAINGVHEAWRYTLISGVVPALPLILIRPFLPESPVWQKKRDAGTLKRPSIIELFGPGLAKTTIVTTLMFAASYGIAFGAIQQLSQILTAPKDGHKQVLARGAEAVVQAKKKAAEEGKPELPEAKIRAIAGTANDQAAAEVATYQEVGGLVGRVIFALVALLAISRRDLFRLFNWPSLIFVPVLFWWISNNLKTDSLTMLQAGIFLAGLLTVAQFSFWGNYIPLVFPVHLRGTGESFAANIGGRVIGTFAAWLTLTFSDSKPPNPANIALVGAYVAGGYALVGAVLSFFLTEPKQQLDSE